MTMKRYSVAGEVVTATGDVTWMGAIGNALSSPLKAFQPTAENVLISEREAGIHSLAAGAVGYLVGEWHGHGRQRAGKKPFLPISYTG